MLTDKQLKNSQINKINNYLDFSIEVICVQKYQLKTATELENVKFPVHFDRAKITQYQGGPPTMNQRTFQNNCFEANSFGSQLAIQCHGFCF